MMIIFIEHGDTKVEESEQLELKLKLLMGKIKDLF